MGEVQSSAVDCFMVKLVFFHSECFNKLNIKK